MIRRLGAVWPFLLIVMLTVMWNYPVYWVTQGVEQGTGGKVKVLSSAGTVWNGQLHLGLSDGNKVWAIPDPIQWKLDWGESGALFAIVVEHPKLLTPLHLGFGTAGIKLKGGELVVPAAWLESTGAPFNTIRPEGQLQLSWNDWEAGAELGAQVTWLNAQSALASIRPLGEYVITVTGNPDTTVNIALLTRKGPLMLEGTGQLAKGQRFVFNGYASAEPRSKDALTGLLSQMGRLEGDRYRLGVF